MRKLNLVHIWDLWGVLLHLPGGLMMKLHKEDRGYHLLRFSALFWNVKSNGDFYFVCLSLFDLYQKATLGSRWSFWVTMSTYVKERFYSLSQDLSPYWNTRGPLCCSHFHYSFYKCLPGTDSAVCARHWAVMITDVLWRTCCPEELRAIWNLLKSHSRQGRMAAIWLCLAICAAWARCRESYMLCRVIDCAGKGVWTCALADGKKGQTWWESE